MKKLQRILAVAAVLSVAAVFSITSLASAASVNGTRIAPVRTELVMQPGSTKIVSVYVRNMTQDAGAVKAVVNDFDAADDESGSPALLLNGESNDKHGLKRFMTITEAPIQLDPKEQKEVKVTITIPKGTAGGGYYGAVRFVPTSSDGNGANVSLSGSVGSLILVKVPGDVTEKLTLVSLDARQNQPPNDVPRTIFTSGKDIYATVRIRNEGNIQEQPFGKVIVKKGGQVVGKYELNASDQPGNVLPDSIRKFQIKLKDVDSFGKYTIEGNFGYGSSGQLLTGKTTFYVIPVWMIVSGLVVLLAIAGAAIWYSRRSRVKTHKAGKRR